MNCWTVYQRSPQDLDDVSSCVYVIEYFDRVKIGRTCHARTRIRTHEKKALQEGKRIGRIAIRYADNECSAERELLHRFAKYRIDDTEEFRVGFDKVVESYEKHRDYNPELEHLRTENKRLLDELKRIKAAIQTLDLSLARFSEEPTDYIEIYEEEQK